MCGVVFFLLILIKSSIKKNHYWVVLAYVLHILVVIEFSFAYDTTIHTSITKVQHLLAMSQQALRASPPYNDQGWVNFFRMGV